MKIDVELLSKSIVKPSSQIPDHLRRHQLSSIDQIMFPIFIPWILFYPKNDKFNNQERCDMLKKSLAEALTVFYPLAGRFKEDYIDCNDEGVHFAEVEAECTIQDILQDPDCTDFNKLLPFGVDSVNDLVVFVQVTYFQCGGMAIGLGLCHTVGDVASLVLFLNDWAAIACGKSNIEVPLFDSATHFPPINASGFDSRFEFLDVSDIVLKRFVFDASSIEALKDKYVNSSDTKNPTRPSRVEAVTAFLSSKFIASIKTDGDDTIYYIYHPLNLRPRMDPSLSHQHFGNIVIEPPVAVANMDAKDRGYDIIRQMRDTIKNVRSEYVKNLQQRDGILSMMKERAERAMNQKIVSFYFTSSCRFPVYEADFGWGKPLMVSCARWPYYNLVVFFDTKEGGGIEAWIHLKKEDMIRFETDKKVISLVSPVPK